MTRGFLSLFYRRISRSASSRAATIDAEPKTIPRKQENKKQFNMTLNTASGAG
jgi:hypothetical protein